jgi:hypothetical protein
MKVKETVRSRKILEDNIKTDLREKKGCAGEK